MKRRRCLIVLDDVWQLEHIKALEIADTPSRILFTTRDGGIVLAIGAVPHVVEELTTQAARAFLAEAVGLAEADLPSAAAEVIKECGRLPLALALAGATLADAPRDEALWRDVLAALAAADHEQLSHEFGYPYPHALAAIQASVDFLPSEDRTAYLQLAIFPEDTPDPSAATGEAVGNCCSQAATPCQTVRRARARRDAMTTDRFFSTICRAISSADVALAFKQLIWRCSTDIGQMLRPDGPSLRTTATSTATSFTIYITLAVRTNCVPYCWTGAGLPRA